MMHFFTAKGVLQLCMLASAISLPRPDAFHVPPEDLDVERLSMAVALVETGNCRMRDRGSAMFNNCHGFRWKGDWKKFASPAESHAYFSWMWQNSKIYSRGFPTEEDAKTYTSNDHPERWLCGVREHYFDVELPDC